MALVGRSLGNYVAAAQEAGYMQDVPDFVPEEEIGAIPDDNLLLVVTGSQGEPRSALARIAADTHRYAVLGDGDSAIFSSRMIPGNERAITAVQDALVRRGVDVITDDDQFTHVSGHPARDELKKLYRLVRPKYIVPTHGEWRHLSAQAELAEAEGIPALRLENGDVLQFAPGAPEIVDSVPTGRLAVDGDRIVPLKGGVLGARRRMLFNGVVVGSFAADSSGQPLGTVRVSAPGLLDDDEGKAAPAGGRGVFGTVARPAAEGSAPRRPLISTAARAGLRKIMGKHFGKRPIVEVHMLQMGWKQVLPKNWSKFRRQSWKAMKNFIVSASKVLKFIQNGCVFYRFGRSLPRAICPQDEVLVCSSCRVTGVSSLNLVRQPPRGWRAFFFLDMK